MMPKNRGGRPGKNLYHDGTGLAELGVSRNLSSRWQRIAKVAGRGPLGRPAGDRRLGVDYVRPGAAGGVVETFPEKVVARATGRRR